MEGIALISKKLQALQTLSTSKPSKESATPSSRARKNCDYCGKSNHISDNCFKKRKDRRKSAAKSFSAAEGAAAHAGSPDSQEN